MAAVVTLAIALAGIIALSQGNAAETPSSAAALNYDAAVVAAAQARAEGEARQQWLSNYDAAVVAAAQARAEGEAKKTGELTIQRAGNHRATPQ